ncbi:23S rRNA accumulation protein YceD [Phocoenobacter skyensis]|uniref:Large ribosomal RNA subunit accumulation protein YceD n=1 Tax=Phocoenobacter skyensis TaxID=97481 RepID=A0A1H7VBN6_9PAST|nr:23S rRNA accumulation protein YceD [Pasteurella skyensis]MDP8079400.1 23S rRNA accumulation protein YceD [Pasteurella skyensis]MDP8085272.1 23S rRNA accumulation protein YceD [Pasteurella skyensis]MDP8162740.1 23S rRNA accumulation protein YceD [Pasteurella skyensis]MDP8170304.1 23S rRNA accumulation protein YceD [Pasteurella skyensis]MDP8173211.1 23S rRNA accumulation protein YceD [Pasteurella skyensis]
MKTVKLPLTINPKKDAQHRLDYEGIFIKSSLNRLGELVSNVLSDAQIKLSLSIDPQGLTVLKGTAKVDVELECQRCSNPFSQTLDCTFSFSPVSNMDQADNLPEIYEPVELNKFGEINLLDTIVDELILNIPLVPKHSDEHCEVSVADMVFGEIPDEEEKKPNPFAVLANLKK